MTPTDKAIRANVVEKLEKAIISLALMEADEGINSAEIHACAEALGYINH